MSELAWAAGLFEGEGSITSTTSRAYPKLSLGISDRDVLQRFADAVGTGRVNGPYACKGPNSMAGEKPMYQWACHGIQPVFRILRDFYPYLGKRRRTTAADVIAEYYLSPVKRNPARRNRAAVSV